MTASPSNNDQTQSQPIVQPSPNDPPPPPSSSQHHSPTSKNDGYNDGSSAAGDGDGDVQEQQQQLSIEYQCYEVDLTNPDMDPLEYAFRKYVPVPREYFWESASEANEHNQNLPFRIKMWHRSIYYLGECLKKAEAGGGIVANFLGLNSGPFDYVTDNMTEEEMAHSQANVVRRREEREETERRKEGGVV